MIKKILLLLFLPLVLYSENLSLNSVMSIEDQRATGLDAVSPSQQAAFEAWLGAWTMAVIEKAHTHDSSTNLQGWVDGWAETTRPVVVKRWRHAASRHQTQQEKDFLKEEEDSPSSGTVLARIRNQGEIVELSDGSSWRIADVDKSTTQYWMRKDVITLEKTKVFFPPYRMTNVTRNQRVDVKERVATSVATDDQEGTLQLRSMTRYAEEITLSDGSVWRIAPTDKQRVLRWRLGDQIRPGTTRDVLYPYSLENIDNGDTIKANKK